ncbi:MAG TPA: extracellular solute-binding protein [Fimbriimonas sp.]
MSTRATLVLMFLACLLLGIARSDLALPAIGKKKTELVFWNGFTGPDGRTMLGMIRRFNEQNPDLHVTMQRMDWATYYNKLMVASVDGRGPQLFIIHAATLPRMVRAGFVSSVDGMFEGPGALPREDFDEYVLEQVEFEKGLVGVPLDIHPQGMYVNLAMLREAGISKPPQTRDEFLRAIRAVNKDLDGDGQNDRWGFALTFWRNNFQSLVPQFGGRYAAPDGRSDLDNPANVKAAEFMGSLTKQKLIPPPENGLGWVGFRQKKVAMVWDGVYMLGDLKRLGDFEYIGTPLPLIGEKPGTMADSHVLCIREGITAAEREGAERFTKFLSANSVEWAAAGQVPARKSVRADPEFQKMQVQSAFAEQIPAMMYPLRTPVLFEMTLEIDLAVEKVMRARASAAQALKAARENTQRFFDRDQRESDSPKALRRRSRSSLVSTRHGRLPTLDPLADSLSALPSLPPLAGRLPTPYSLTVSDSAEPCLPPLAGRLPTPYPLPISAAPRQGGEA